jgi:hypothetical protein
MPRTSAPIDLTHEFYVGNVGQISAETNFIEVLGKRMTPPQRNRLFAGAS